MSFNHVMLDIETLGTRSGSVITSIGAIVFCPHNGPSQASNSRFYQTIDVNSSLKAGLTIDGSTLKWWLKHDPATMNKMFVDTISLEKALDMFSSFLNQNGGKDLYMWGRSPRFDEGKIQDAYEAIGAEIPWDFRREMCVRTIMELTPGVWETTPSMGDAHDPIVDALKQIEAVRRAYCVLSNKF
jgi:exodeoxyribonuclease VIII